MAYGTRNTTHDTQYQNNINNAISSLKLTLTPAFPFPFPSFLDPKRKLVSGGGADVDLSNPVKLSAR